MKLKDYIVSAAISSPRSTDIRFELNINENLEVVDWDTGNKISFTLSSLGQLPPPDTK